MKPETLQLNGTDSLLCVGSRLDDRAGVGVGIYYLGDSQARDAGVTITLTVAASRLGQVPAGSFFLLRVPGESDVIPISPGSVTAEDGYLGFSTAREFAPNLTRVLGRTRTIELLRTDIDAIGRERLLTIDVPRQYAVRQALRRCEATQGAEGPTRAAYATSSR